MDADVQPKFYKARSVPYSMKVLVEQELDRLAEEGTIEPLAFSEWAAPNCSSSEGGQDICQDLWRFQIDSESGSPFGPVPYTKD